MYGGTETVLYMESMNGMGGAEECHISYVLYTLYVNDSHTELKWNKSHTKIGELNKSQRIA